MERTAERLVVASTPERCFAVVTAIEHYPEWVADVKDVEVLERDGDGRVTLAGFRVGAFGRSAHYVLAYDYSGAPGELSWSQRDGDITSRLDGRYRFTAESETSTEVSYELGIELKVPIPGFVRRRAEGHILHAAIRDLKARVESSV